MKINTTMLRVMREEIHAQLAGIAAKYQVDLRLGKCSYTENSATFKLEVQTVDAAGNGEADRETFNVYAELFGLTKEDWHAQFRQGGHIYTIIGIKPKAHAYPILCDRDGMRYKLSRESVRQGLTMARIPTAAQK